MLPWLSMVMAMTEIGTGVETIIARVAVCIVALSAIIQISPIKLNPWSWLARHIGRAINKEVIEKVDGLEKDVNNLRADMHEQSARDARARILRFGDEILHGTKHSQEHFDEILACITDYTKYCDEHPEFKNHVTVITTQHILDVYDKCRRENSFL